MASAPALFHDVEQRFMKLSEALEAATAERDELRTAAAEHESGLAKLTLSLTSAQRGRPSRRSAGPPRSATRRLDGARGGRRPAADRFAELRAAELAAASADAQRALADARKEARENTEKCARAESQVAGVGARAGYGRGSARPSRATPRGSRTNWSSGRRELRDSRGASLPGAGGRGARAGRSGATRRPRRQLEASEERRAAAPGSSRTTAAAARLRDARARPRATARARGRPGGRERP